MEDFHYGMVLFQSLNGEVGERELARGFETNHSTEACFKAFGLLLVANSNDKI